VDDISDEVGHDDADDELGELFSVDVRLLTRAVLVEVTNVVRLEVGVDTAADETVPVELLNVDVGVVVFGYELDKVLGSVADDVPLLGTE